MGRTQIWHGVTPGEALADRPRGVFTKLHLVFFYSSTRFPTPYTTSGPSRVAHASIQFTEQPKSGGGEREYISVHSRISMSYLLLFENAPLGRLLEQRWWKVSKVENILLSLAEEAIDVGIYMFPKWQRMFLSLVNSVFKTLCWVNNWKYICQR